MMAPGELGRSEDSDSALPMLIDLAVIITESSIDLLESPQPIIIIMIKKFFAG